MPVGTLSRLAAAATALALIAACSPHSGMAPPQLLTGEEIAALGSQAAPVGTAGGADIDSLAAGLTRAEAPGSADLGPRGEALRARAAALRGREATQAGESDTLRRRAAALREESQARATRSEDDEEERRLRD